MKNWVDIKNEIYNQEENLTADDNRNMRAMIGSRNSRRLWMLSAGLLLLSIVIGSFLFAGFSKPSEGNDKQLNSKISNKEVKPVLDDGNTVIEGAKDDDIPLQDELGLSVTTSRTSVTSQRFTNVKVLNQESVQKPTYLKEPPFSISKGFQFDCDSCFPKFGLKPIDTIDYVPEIKPYDIAQGEFIARLSYSSTYNYPNFVYPSGGKVHKDFSAAIAGSVLPDFGRSVDLEILYKLSNSFTIGTGLGFEKMAFQNNYDFEIQDIPVLDSASGEILFYLSLGDPEHQKYQGVSEFSFVKIPIIVSFGQPISRFWSMEAELVHNSSFLVDQSHYFLDPTLLEMQKANQEDFRPFINSVQLQLGLKYRIAPKTYFGIQASYNSYYQSLLKSDLIKLRPNSLALKISFSTLLGNFKSN